MSGTFDWEKILADKEGRNWPYKSEYGQVCRTCASHFLGPKRAPNCWLCTGDNMRNWWVKENNREQ